MIQAMHSLDILLWPCGTMCYRKEHAHHDYQQLGSEFQVIPVGSPGYENFDAEMNSGGSLDTGGAGE